MVPALAADLDAGPRRLPSADAYLHKVLGRHIGDVSRVEPGRRVHALVKVGSLGIDVAVKVDDSQVPPIQVLCNAPHCRVSDAVVAAQHDRERAAGKDVSNTLGDLVKRLLDVGGDGEDVANVCDGYRLAKVDTYLEGVSAVQGRYLSNALGPEPGP